ncbi:hypothetical protein [Propionivibrio sp.]|uniref:hypothetical protein n=1 Tax=Propionivibrio sp. TaxID=2212460 RepID=UPI003BF1A5AA
MDFFSQKELTAQTGHHVNDWPTVIIKELIDNGLDACEDASIAPVLQVTFNADGISVIDNGPGLPASTIDNVLDFSIRESSREAYVSPTRGAQGNALKTLVAMPFVMDGDHGVTTIEAHGTRHTITLSVDRIRQVPVIDHQTETIESKKGTFFHVGLKNSPWLKTPSAKARFLQVATDYTRLNPHLNLTVAWIDGSLDEVVVIKPTTGTWDKWKPSDPTSPHWYNLERLERLIAAYISKEPTKTVREFVAEFRGLSGTGKQKAVLDTLSLSRVALSTLETPDGLDHLVIELMLYAMQQNSKPVPAKLLGEIGRAHFEAKFAASGCNMESFSYKRIYGEREEQPWVIEAAFGYGRGIESRIMVTGVNWSPGLLNPFRDLAGVSLDTVLTRQRVDHEQPVMFAMHIACPQVSYLDRGKSSLVIEPDQAEAIVQCTESVTKAWCKQVKAEERHLSARLNREDALTKVSKTSTKDAAYQCMEAAYLKASGGGIYPAHARQIMYAARPFVQEITGTDMDDKYFIKTLLPSYIEEKGVTWNIVYDARGHFTEPHTGHTVALGTLGVREYLRGIARHRVSELAFDFAEARYPTMGPKNRYQTILFIEKEGFMPLFEQIKLAERYDIAIMSTKGTSVTASRELIDSLCKDGNDVRLLVLHDFDKAGFSILQTLTNDTWRYKFDNKVEVIDLGVRLGDIDGLSAERVQHTGDDPAANLRDNGATEDEIKFLLTQRVELNAFTSDQFVAWIEGKLKAHGVEKVVPDDDTLHDAYQRIHRMTEVQKVIDKAIDDMDDSDLDPPDDLADQIRAIQADNTTLTWDAALRRIVASDTEEVEV